MIDVKECPKCGAPWGGWSGLKVAEHRFVRSFWSPVCFGRFRAWREHRGQHLCELIRCSGCGWWTSNSKPTADRTPSEPLHG